MYCVIVWGNTFKSHLYRLQNLQIKAFNLCCAGNINSTDNNNKLSFIDINGIYTLECAKLMYKEKNKLLPLAFENFFQSYRETHQYNTRATNNYRTLYTRTTIMQLSVKISAPKIWNLKVPNNIKNIKSIHAFNRQFKKHIVIGQ